MVRNNLKCSPRIQRHKAETMQGGGVAGLCEAHSFHGLFRDAQRVFLCVLYPASFPMTQTWINPCVNQSQNHSQCPRASARSVLTGRRLRRAAYFLVLGGGAVGRNKLRPSRVRTPRAEGGAGTARVGPNWNAFGRHAPRAARVQRASGPIGTPSDATRRGGAGTARAGSSRQLPPRLRGYSIRPSPPPGMMVKGRTAGHFAPVSLRAVVRLRNGRSDAPDRSQGGRRGRSSSRRPPPGP